MKISFDTTVTGKDSSGTTVALSPADIAALTYTAYIDTVNPPVKAYPIPSAKIVGPANPNGSVRVTVDAVADLGVTVVDNTQYFIDLKDSIGNAVSAATQVMTFTEVVTPDPPANPSVG